MLTRECVFIKRENDYEKILRFIDSQYVDENLIQQLKKHIGLQCKLVAIDFPYYENDYLSSYYIFYAKKLQKFPKECYRLLFYADKKARKLMGYITLRPTYEGRHLGKIYFEPQYLVKEKVSLILGECKCHIGGSESILKIFPHMKQEGDVAVCAHVATWSVLRTFANRFHRYSELTLGKIVEMVSPESERMIPSRGLTAFQISQVFLDAGFSPVVLSKDERNPRLIREALISYIASGIPVVAVLTNRNHAISIVGLGDQKPQHGVDLKELVESYCPYESYWDGDNEVMTNVVLSSRFCNSVVVNDDNYFPYAMARMKRPTQIATGDDTIPYTIPEIDRLIIPLYSRIQLSYEDIRTIFLRMVSTYQEEWGGPIVARIFLASANTYREYVNSIDDTTNTSLKQIKHLLINLELPKFIWCVEASSVEHYQQENPIVDGLVIFDSTSSTINAEPFLFLAFPNGAVRVKTNSEIIECKEEDGCSLSIPQFNRNLLEVN